MTVLLLLDEKDDDPRHSSVMPTCEAQLPNQANGSQATIGITQRSA